MEPSILRSKVYFALLCRITVRGWRGSLHCGDVPRSHIILFEAIEAVRTLHQSNPQNLVTTRCLRAQEASSSLSSSDYRYLLKTSSQLTCQFQTRFALEKPYLDPTAKRESLVRLTVRDAALIEIRVPLPIVLLLVDVIAAIYTCQMSMEVQMRPSIASSKAQNSNPLVPTNKGIRILITSLPKDGCVLQW